jgi:hypothetical protein
MKTGFLLIVALGFFSAVEAQTKKNPKPTATPTPVPSVEVPVKRNGRPVGENSSGDQPSNATAPTHFYEFVRPGFSYGRIAIEHDDAGRGTITFLKDGNEESLTDPIELSKVTLAKITDALTSLKFLDSADEYQYSRDYSHMGNMTFTLRRDGRARTVKFNWTDIAQAKVLMDEYRRISNEYTWRFEMFLARDNMPLQTPGLMEAIESYVKRNEISDPQHLVPVLTKLSNDERLPLMARNRAVKLIGQIEKRGK